MYFKYRIV